MAYHRAYIQQCEAFGWAGGPEFRTTINEMRGGRERRNADWSQARHKFTVPYQNISDDGWSAVATMFYVCRGQLDCFLYRDRLNSQAQNTLFGVGTGALQTFQLSTLWNLMPGVSYQRDVYALPDDPDDLVVTINGTPTTAFSIDRDRGLITFNTAPANGAVLRWSGTFDIWVRFNTDWLPASIDNLRGADSKAINMQIELIECAAPILEVS